MKALKLQLASAEDKAYLQREESARAAEKAGAREAFVAGLEAQLQGSQGKLTPLNTQLSRLAKRLDFKVGSQHPLEYEGLPLQDVGSSRPSSASSQPAH